MIGRIKGDGWAATLEDDGRWACADELIALFLEAEFNRDTYSEADGVFGLRLLNDAADRLGGEVQGIKGAEGAESVGQRDIILSIYVCTEGHLHVATRTQGVVGDDQILGRADEWPDLKAISRDELGRFAPCGGAGGGSGGTGRGERERREEGERKLEKARQLIKDIKGGPQPVPHSKVRELHDHLGTMTVAQIHQIKREHDLKASGKDKAALQAKLAVRFARTPKGGSPRPTAEIPEGTFGKPKRLQWAPGVEDKAHEAARELMGNKAWGRDLAACAGAPDGARVIDVHRSEYKGRVEYSVEFSGTQKYKDPDTGKVTDEEYEGYRTLVKHPDGTKTIENGSFSGKGAGLGMLGRQVENASRAGFEKIETFAAGQGGGVTGQRNPDSHYNGYYTWPRFGYQGNVEPEHIARMPPALQADVAQAGGKISGLMATKAGRDWWLGHGDSLSATFDLRPGSYSQRTLLSNLKERGILK
jgi:hypothetical protein